MMKQWRWSYGGSLLLSGTVHALGLSLGVYYASHQSTVSSNLPTQPLAYTLVMEDVLTPEHTLNASAESEALSLKTRLVPQKTPAVLHQPSIMKPHKKRKRQSLTQPAVASEIAASPPVTVVPLSTNQVPQYPENAKNRGIEGTVTLKLIVGADGRVQRTEVLTPNAHALLITASETAVRTWCFKVMGLRHHQTTTITAPFIFKVSDSLE